MHCSVIELVIFLNSYFGFKLNFKLFTFSMSQITNEILEKLKTLTLFEASELVSQIEDTFGVDASASIGTIVSASLVSDEAAKGATARTEKVTFDVVLESIAEDKRVASLKIVRSLTSLGLKEAKDFCSALPKAVKESVSREEAEIAKKELEGAGGTVTIK
jgi:large subunit ribosomal protein L7/L12